MNEFDVVTVIGCPPEEVFAVVQDVTRTCRSWPRDFSAQADNAVRKWLTAHNKKPHCECRRMPAAGDEPAEETASRCRLVKMLRLRVEFGGEGLDLPAIDGDAIRSERLAQPEIFQIANGRVAGGRVAIWQVAI
jgi:hypothetical protein